MTTANTTVAVQYEWVKIIPIFLSNQQKIYFLVCRRISVISFMCTCHEKKKVENHRVKGYCAVNFNHEFELNYAEKWEWLTLWFTKAWTKLDTHIYFPAKPAESISNHFPDHP